MLPVRYDSQFGSFSQQNCISPPLMGEGLAGNPTTFGPPSSTALTYPPFNHATGVRADLPKYNVYRGGKLIATADDISEYWSDQNAAFLISRSYPFNPALVQAGLQPQHYVTSTAVPMYRTTPPMNPVGAFTPGAANVSMCPYRLSDIARTREIMANYGIAASGEPITWGWDTAETLVIDNIYSLKWSEAVEFDEDEVPVFWSRGVTLRDFLMDTEEEVDEVGITHYPDRMLVYYL
jgi:uncharacterized protein YcsI (UPF0317 family)